MALSVGIVNESPPARYRIIRNMSYRRLPLIVLFACSIHPAFAQQPDPFQAALGQEVMECVGAKIQLKTKLNQIEAELAKAMAPPPQDAPPK